MRKRGKVYETTEKYSVLRALSAIDRSDVCLIVIDASKGLIEQDKRVAGYAHEAGKAVVIVVNKWDAIEKTDKTMKEWEELLHFSYKRYLENCMRQAFGFEGTPIHIIARNRD